MPASINTALRVASLRLLRPLVRLLIRHGMAYGTFAELARKAYVEEGFEEIAALGKRPTVSGVSALTGLTRKETKRLRELNEVGDEASGERYNRAIRVISGWLNDKRFQTGNGKPAILPLEEGSASFAVLVKDYSGDIPPAAMLSVLELSNTVRVGEQGVELMRRAYLPSDTPVDKIHILGSDVAELTSTISHNIEADGDQLWFQRKVSNIAVRQDALAEFRALSNRKSQELLEEYHSWLRFHQVEGEQQDSENSWYVSVGIFYYEHEVSEND